MNTSPTAQPEIASWQVSPQAMPYVYDDGGRRGAGYKGDTGDCVTRAVAIAAELPYQQVYDRIVELGKAERLTKRRRSRSHPRTGVHKPTCRKLLAELGWTWVPTMTIGSGTTVHLRPGELPAGRLVVQCSKHLVAVLDGVVHDSHDPGRYGTRAVYGYWHRPDTPTGAKRVAPAANRVYAAPQCRRSSDPAPRGDEATVTIAQVREIPDVEKRARAASKIVREAQEKADEARIERDLAAVVLHKREGWPPVKVYRALEVSRGLFVRMVLRAPATLPAIENPERVMRRAAKTVERNDALMTEAREVRDEAARGMLNGKYRKPSGATYRNAEVARITGLTTARIAQMRQGRR